MKAVTHVLGEPPDDVVLAPPHAVLKTSSGKIRRAASREAYESGRIGAGSRAIGWQMARLAWTGAAAQVRRALLRAGMALDGARALGAFALLAPVAWLVTAALRGPGQAWAFSRFVARLFLALAGIPLRVHGLENLPRGSPHVLVANHASYLDGLILVAALPRPYRFVAKRELLRSFVARVYLQRLGAEFVERFSTRRSVADAERLATLAQAGAPLAVFPEGTFQRAPGLLAFHLGAFAAAVKAGVPVLPVALRGTRSVLAAGEWIARRNAVIVSIAAPLAAPAAGPDAFAAAVTLRDQARAAILREAGELDAGHAP